MFTLGGVRPGNLRAGEAGTGGVGAGFPRPYADPPPDRGCAPSRTLPHWGRAPGSSPQRGEAGRGAEPGERWSPQRIRRRSPPPYDRKRTVMDLPGSTTILSTTTARRFVS